MRYLLFILLLVCALSSAALATDIDIAATTLDNFNRTDIGSDVTVSSISATNGLPTLTCSSCFPSNVVGLAGWRITINGVDYTAASCTSRSAVTLTTNFSSSTSTYSGTLRKFVHLRIYLVGPAFIPAGDTVPIQPGAIGSQNWYIRVAASVQSDGITNTLYVPQINNVPATTNGVPATSRWAGVFYTQGGTQIQDFPGCIQSWRLSHLDDPTTWSQICSFNVTQPPPPDTARSYYTTSEINTFLPSCTAGQIAYFAASGRPQACLTVGTGLAITGGTLNSTGISSAYSTIQEEGSGLTQRSILNFVGSSATAADDTTRTTVTFASPLNALASNSTAGFWAPTGAVTGNARTITGTANEIDVANGNGSAGNPTISLPTTIILTGKAITGGTFGSPTINFPTIVGANVRNATNVMLYGCVGNGIADDTSCINSAYAGAVASAGQTLYFPAGTYLFDGLTITGSNLIVVGDGPGHSILQSRTNAAAVITINNTAAARNGIKIRDIQLTGFGSGANNHGIASTGVTARNSLTVENVKISACGGSAILSSGGALSNSRFIDLDLDQPSGAVGHTIDVFGAGVNQLVRVYVHNVADNLTAFRLRGVNWLLDSVIAQDTGTGTGWGIIGEDVTNDGQSTPTFLDCRGCTITLWSGTDGVDFRSASYGSFRHSTINSASSGLNKRAMRFRGMTNGTHGIFDAASSITLNGTATWLNSQPIHSVEPPFLEVGAQEVSNYYDTTLTTTIAMAGIREFRVDSSRAGVYAQNLALGTSSSQGMISHILFAADNTYNIGTASSGQRPANIYVSSTGFFNNAIQVGAPSGSTGEARLYNSSNSNAVRLGAPAGASDYAFTFPSSLPTAGNEFLQISNVGAVTTNIAVWQNKGTDYTPDITVANTTTETSIMGTADVGSFSISANTARVGQMYKMIAGGTIGGLGTGALTGNITVKWKLGVGGGTTICNSGAIAINQDGTGATWSYETYAVITALGGSGSITCYRGTFFYNSTNGGAAISFGTGKTTTAIDTTVANAFDSSVQFSAADPKNTITRTWAQIETAR